MNRNAPERPNFFPMMVDLQGKKCVVVGGGKIAAEKIAGLLEYGAKVTVVSPAALSSIQKRARAGDLIWKKRRFTAHDPAGAFLVIAATNSPATNSAVFHASRRFGALCNAVDDPDNCNFFYPAVMRRGRLQIAISTNGRSPAAAARLRRELEPQFGPEWGEWIEHIGEARAALMREELSPALRKKRILELASEESFRGFIRDRNRKSQSH